MPAGEEIWRIFASVTAGEKEGEGGRRRKRRRGRKKERERRKRRKEEGRRGGVHSPTRFHYSICGVKSCASFSVTTRCRCYCFPRGTSLLHFLLPAFALLLLPATAASPAPTSSPIRTSIASFTTTLRLLLPPTSAILCFRFLLVSRFRFLFTGSFPTSDIHVAYQSPVSSLVGLPRRCSATDLATMTAIHRQSNALVPRFATLGRRPACMLSMFRVCEDVNPHLHSFHPPRHYPRPPPSPPPSPLPLPLPAVHPQSMVRRVRYLPTLAARS